MTPAIATKLARLAAQFPYKPYRELCAMLAKRRRTKPVAQNKAVRLPYCD